MYGTTKDRLDKAIKQKKKKKKKKEQSWRHHAPDLKLYYKVILIKKCMAQNTDTEINEMEGIGEGDYKVQNSSYKISHRDVTYIQGI